MFTFKPHETVVDPRNGLPAVEHRADFVMLSQGSESVYVQQGTIYCGDFESPRSPDEAPVWFWDSYRRLTPQARTSCGLKLPEDEVQHVSQLPAEFLATFNSLPENLKRQLIPTAVGTPEAPRMPVEAPKIPDEGSDEGAPSRQHVDDPDAPRGKPWTCEECGEEVGTIRKGVHIGRHRREAKARARKEN